MLWSTQPTLMAHNIRLPIAHHHTATAHRRIQHLMFHHLRQELQ
jgi:hypothetical protein